jgi:AcrR family transcriptional regulator
VTRASLDRDAIVAACLELVDELGVEALTMRRLGQRLGVDATAVYRHFRDKDDLLRAIGDRAHAAVLGDLRRSVAPGAAWREVVRELCIELRAAHLARPDLAALVRAAPSLHEHELHLTETLLGELGRARLRDDDIVHAYHALIELTVGSAAIDATLAAQAPRERTGTYRAWRRTYAALDEHEFPAATRLASHLYPGDADDRFAVAVDLLLDGIVARSRRTRREARAAT